MSLPEIEFEKFLGKGSYGSVSLFKYSKPHTSSSLYTAVKTSGHNNGESLLQEFEILSQFKGCSRIVQCYENKVRKNLDIDGNVEYMMLMEYASGGSLRSFMDLLRDNIIPEPFIKKFTRMLLQGLAVIHTHGYVHCDLKPENILVFHRYESKNGALVSTYELKISDFGVSKRDGDSSWWSPSQAFVGTPIYMSPESISHGETTKELDLWSLGCVVLEMYTGRQPWWHTHYELHELKRGYEPLIPNDLPNDATEFIEDCFMCDEDETSDAFTLLNHPFLHRDMRNIVESPTNSREFSLAFTLSDTHSAKTL